MNRLETKSPVESLMLSLSAYKSLVSDYALRARQAEDMTAQLMIEKLGPEVIASMVVNKVQEHIEARGLERSVQYHGIIQTTLMALTNIRRSGTTGEALDQELLEIIRALTIASGA